jgi:dihydroneopterin aldolase
MTIHIRGLEVRGNHGVLPEERENGQPFIIDVAMEVSDLTSCTTDDLNDTVDYGAVSDDVAAIVAGPAVDLIERLARLIADRVLEEPRVDAVTVTVHKPEAPVAQVFDEVAVTLRAERSPV